MTEAITKDTIVAIKANPFLMLASDYHEFSAMQAFLQNLFPAYNVSFDEVSWQDVKDEINNDEITVRSCYGYAGYVAWFKIVPHSA